MNRVPFAYAFFSTLHGKSSIDAHCAPANLRLRVHYPLIVPDTDDVEQCGMRVGDTKVRWEEGVPLLFDDSYEHEVWNRTDEERVVLLFDVWHPDLTQGEREAVTDMFGYAREQGWLKG